MLTRIAESLFWTGRYIARSSHLARFLRVQYFSTLDASMMHNKEFTLRSIINMVGMEMEAPLQEEEVLTRVGFDNDNATSILSTVTIARENAISLRHMISSELWESINRYYHFTQSYSPEMFVTSGLYDFTTKVEEHVKIVQSNVNSTLIRNNVYNFYMLGYWLENTIQIIRILRSKLIDTEILSENGSNIPVMHYQWMITLKSLESFDMHNVFYNHNMSFRSVAEFLIANDQFPRSICFNMTRILKCLVSMDIIPDGFRNLHYHVSKLESQTKFFEYEDHEQLHQILDALLRKTEVIYQLCSNLYFNSAKS